MSNQIQEKKGIVRSFSVMLAKIKIKRKILIYTYQVMFPQKQESLSQPFTLS